MNHELKVMSFNIHKGLHYLTRRKVLADLRQIIVESGVEIVCLQEIRGEPQVLDSEQRLASQLEYLADTVWPHYAYGLNAVYEAGHHGNAILSKFPILRHENMDISNHPLEQRGILHAIIEPKSWGVPVHLLCLHFDLTSWGRGRQIGRLIERVMAAVPEDEPLVIAGDFNDWSEQASRRLTAELDVLEAHKLVHGNYAKTFPSFFPVLPLDRIYVRGLSVADCQVQQWALSDHRAVVASMTWQKR